MIERKICQTGEQWENRIHIVPPGLVRKLRRLKLTNEEVRHLGGKKNGFHDL